MTTLANSDLTIFICYVLWWVFCKRINQLFPAVRRHRSLVQKFIRNLLAAITNLLLFSILCYILLRFSPKLAAGVETWLIGLDIALAHFAVTLPILLFIFFVTDYFWDLLAIIVMILDRFWGSLVTLLLKFGTSLLCIWFTLIKISDIQMLLFGAYDPNLGYFYPTTYRFSVLANHIQESREAMASNDVIASVIWLAAVLVGVIVGLSGIVKAVDDISNGVVNQSANSKHNW